ncbi:MAG: dihydrofolate reductase [Pacificimonas sp.]
MTRPELIAVAAVCENRVIGADGGMPWHLPEDLKHFKRLTVGKPCIMGRRTFESMNGPLPARHNIVMTRQGDWTHEGAHVVSNLADAVAEAGSIGRARPEAIMVIGGAEIYELALPSLTVMKLTEIHATPKGDTFFPEFDRNGWRETRRERRDGPDGQPDFSFVTLVRC